MRIALLYTLFAAIATVVNLGTQALVHPLLPDPWGLYAGILAGTITGLVTKYVLDKRWIFGFTARSRSHEARTFILYGLFSVATTVIFWGFELGFEWLFAWDGAKYLGAVVGLAIGYLSKYQLDKRFTFTGADIPAEEA